ncbi:hypothetical protein MmiAt1_15350 [Methanimicrococcus sp. At1]|uniref:ATPase domain-containing protein n=1 Tax=Methanimicrococcus hacksteinii TaxID=3028293 RepID=A0ABU3VRA7_9EURY|nr:ATP-binding protein [Methanimicrococcus sp. At1]MDV0445931.1 hypothetical protein [Methanimicrococcus sp. At1]
MKIIGRDHEKKALADYFKSERPEFVAVYGRRRVGKTFLIKESFENDFSFYFTGSANANMQDQLHNFNAALNQYGKVSYPFPKSWFEAFEQLVHLLEHSSDTKKVIFLDEVPWMDTPRSKFIPALEYFWNSWASSRPDILLIVCGSATSWMMNNLIQNKGGLYNRITRRMFIEPFTLNECERYFHENNIVMSRYQIAEYYMILGGIPYYLNLIDKKLSLAQNIDKLCFSKNGELTDELDRLYASLFKYSENHIKIVEFLSRKSKGMTRDEISRNTKISDGGGLVKNLVELEQCGFIRKYHAFGKKKGYLYQLIDFYTLFYFKFMINNTFSDSQFWLKSIDSARHRSWSGYAFEQVCLTHVLQIQKKLGVSGVLTNISSWRGETSDTGAQVDLIIDRNDGVINLCEMKYSGTGLFAIDKKYSENLNRKKSVFIQKSGSRKAIHLTMVTTYGIQKNIYSDMIQSEVTLNDLFDAL